MNIFHKNGHLIAKVMNIKPIIKRIQFICRLNVSSEGNWALIVFQPRAGLHTIPSGGWYPSSEYALNFVCVISFRDPYFPFHFLLRFPEWHFIILIKKGIRIFIFPDACSQCWLWSTLFSDIEKYLNIWRIQWPSTPVLHQCLLTYRHTPPPNDFLVIMVPLSGWNGMPNPSSSKLKGPSCSFYHVSINARRQATFYFNSWTLARMRGGRGIQWWASLVSSFTLHQQT